MKRTKRLMATMTLAIVATMSTSQAYAGILITDVNQSTERSGIGILDIAGHMLGDIVGIMMGDIAGHMLGD